MRPEAPSPAPPGPKSYSLDWKAQGRSFFSGFNFQWQEHNHGAAAFAGSQQEAEKTGVVEAYSTHAIIRAGRHSKTWAFKRHSAKIETKKSWKYFLAMMKFDHVPYGCGVWPAFFTLAPGVPWPQGGEMDILEYVNDQGSMTSFHTSQECVLDPAQVNKYGSMPDANGAFNKQQYNCLTKYCDTCHSLGCAPNAMPLRTGEQWAQRPGVLAMERTEAFAKIFYIPTWSWEWHFSEEERRNPQPENWDEYVIAYYPFADSPGCPMAKDVMAPQALIFTIAFCGDWASKVWGDSPTCSKTGPKYNRTATEQKLPLSAEGERMTQCRAVDPLAEYAPQEDCCTQFIFDEDGRFGTDDYLRDRAFFNISWLKVFT